VYWKIRTPKHRAPVRSVNNEYERQYIRCLGYVIADDYHARKILTLPLKRRWIEFSTFFLIDYCYFTAIDRRRSLLTTRVPRDP